MHADLSHGMRLRLAMDHGCVAAPGAFNALSALSIAKAGFQACYVSGAATSVCAGVPDVGLLDRGEFCRVIREVSVAGGLPVLADADTGFGEEEQVRRTVIEYHHAGAAGLHIEDQVFPKRCGHLDGKELLDADRAAGKIAWAVGAANDCSDGTMIVCARTDARGVDGLDAAIERARLYVEAGADMIFPEGLGSREEFAAFAEAMNALGSQRPYLLANMTEFGKTPMLPLSDFAQMGYDIVIYPVSLLRAAMKAVEGTLRALKAHGTLEGELPNMQTRAELYGLIGYTPGTPWEMPGR
jgi:methylisocitrate lyase